MDRNAAVSPFLNTAQAAHYLGMSPKTLEKMRVHGNGPKFRKHGGRVAYTLPELDFWSASRTRASTHPASSPALDEPTSAPASENVESASPEPPCSDTAP